MSAIEWLHYHRVAHLDLKFDNILVDAPATAGIGVDGGGSGAADASGHSLLAASTRPEDALAAAVLANPGSSTAGEPLLGSVSAGQTGAGVRLALCDFGCAQFCDADWLPVANERLMNGNMAHKVGRPCVVVVF